MLVLVTASTFLTVQAQDSFVMKDGQVRPVTILRADAQNFYYQTPAGEIPQPLASIKTFKLAERQGVAEARAAADAGQFATAIPVLKQVDDNFGLLRVNVDWVMSTSVALARCYTEQKQYTEAEQVINKFVQTHKAEENRVKPFEAIVLAGRGDYDSAIKHLQEVVQGSEKSLTVTPTESRMYGAAFLALGDCYKAKGDDEKALESYLTTVVLYYHDSSLVRQAETKAAELKEKRAKAKKTGA